MTRRGDTCRKKERQKKSRGTERRRVGKTKETLIKEVNRRKRNVKREAQR